MNHPRKERSDALVLFGVTGDLVYKKLFPALYAMAKRGARATKPRISWSARRFTL